MGRNELVFLVVRNVFLSSLLVYFVKKIRLWEIRSRPVKCNSHEHSCYIPWKQWFWMNYNLVPWNTYLWLQHTKCIYREHLLYYFTLKEFSWHTPGLLCNMNQSVVSGNVHFKTPFCGMKCEHTTPAPAEKNKQRRVVDFLRSQGNFLIRIRNILMYDLGAWHQKWLHVSKVLLAYLYN